MHRTQFRKSFLLFGLLVFVASLLPAADAPNVKRDPIIIPMTNYGLSRVLGDIPPAPRDIGIRRVIPNRSLWRQAIAADGKQGDVSAAHADSEQTWSGAFAMPSALVNFEGVGEGLPGYNAIVAPPDTNGDVGPNHYMQTVNLDLAVFSKAGTIASGFPKPIRSLWSDSNGGDPDPFSNPCATTNHGDPTVVYDQFADRWIIAQFSVSNPYYECVAVSETGDPTGKYYRYAFQFSDFNDYPKMAVWPDGYYVTFNMFAGGFIGGKVCAMDRVSMLSGAAASMQCFDDEGSACGGGLLAADIDGGTPPPGGSPEFVLQIDWCSYNSGTRNFNKLNLWAFHVDWQDSNNSSFGGPTKVVVNPFAMACGADLGSGTCAKQPNTTQKLDSLADRLMNRLAYRNFGDHESLVVTHSTTKSPSKPGNSKIAIRWYELRDPNGTPTVVQQSTYIPDASSRWMGSAAMDKLGNMAMGFSIVNKKKVIFPGIRVTGRLAGDSLNQMTQGETTVMTGTGSQTSGLSRWGDYSSMNVDPTDDCTFWFTTEYMAQNGTWNWRTRIASFKFPGCN